MRIFSFLCMLFAVCIRYVSIAVIRVSVTVAQQGPVSCRSTRGPEATARTGLRWQKSQVRLYLLWVTSFATMFGLFDWQY
jgi:hypothetical protein